MLSTKVGRMLVPAPDKTWPDGPFMAGLPFRIAYDYSADGAKRSIEDLLQRLGLAPIDIAYIHDTGEYTYGPTWREVARQALEGAAVALARLREEGVIRAWGMGVNRVEARLEALDHADRHVVLLAGRYSLLEQPARAELLPRCVARGVHVVVGDPTTRDRSRAAARSEPQP